MENASKALLIAGAMLLTILLLSIFMLINSKIAGTTSNIYGELKESDITEFNQRFLNYEEKAYKTDKDGNHIGLTMQDVISLANLAKDSNKRAKFPVTVEVNLTGAGFNNENLAAKTDSELEELLKNHFDETFMYCNITYAPNSKLVGKVEIKLN